MKKSLFQKKAISTILDFFGTPLIFVSGIYQSLIRRVGLRYFPKSTKTMMKVGVFPIIDHYYDPLFNPKYLNSNTVRTLPALDLRISDQLTLLDHFHYADELRQIPIHKQNENEFYFNNQVFGIGDAECYYSLIRYKKPHKIIEIGAGFSTLICLKAIVQNKIDDPTYNCDVICIEPYENSWLEKLPTIQIIRQKVEELSITVFQQLHDNDILFIDSSHIIRPQGDVLYEINTILPMLNNGVLIHFHDIFTQEYYPNGLYVQLWNEQYLLEAFLMLNSHFKILIAMNYLLQMYRLCFATSIPAY